MEPHCLSTDELQYELGIRGFAPIITRHRLATLRDRLVMESRNEVPRPIGYQNIDPIAEVELCANKFKELETVFKELVETNSDKILNSLPSRFIHLLTRLERLNPVDAPTIIDFISSITKKIHQYMQLIFKAREGNIVLKDYLNKSSIEFSVRSSSTEKEKEVVNVPPPVITGTIPKSQGAQCLPLSSDPVPINPESNFHNSIEDISSYLTQLNLESQSDPKPNQQSEPRHIHSLYHKTKPNYSENPQRTNNYYKQNPVGNTPYAPIPNIARYQNYNQPTQNQPLRNNNYNPYQRPPFKYGYQEPNLNYPQYENPNYYEQPFLVNNDRVHYPRHEDFEVQGPPQNRNNRYNILSWKLTFTGEGGISLHDFLIQIPLMARADQISENTLLASAIHLFGGSAREWYIAFQHTFHTWGDLITALREQFLPDDSDYILMKKIESRVQQRNERFVLYLSNMLNMFSHLINEIPEIQKIAIIKRNMLPYLADRLALTRVESLNQLSSFCRKIESIHSSRNITDFEYPSQHFPPKQKQRQFNNFELNEIPTFNNISAIRQHPQNGETRCWNCKNEGHDYTNCSLKRLRVFCYKCGEVGQASPTCLKCHPEPKNLNRGADRSEVRLLSREY